MATKPEALGHFIFNSDYPIDKVVWLYEGELPVWDDETQSRDVYIPMQDFANTKIPIFVKGAFTLDDWQSTFMVGATHSDDKGASVSMSWSNWPSVQLELGFTGNFVRFYPGRTIKYRLWGVAREDIELAVDYPKNSSKYKNKLIFDTDRNYPRLYKDGIAKSGDVIEHNLGKIPYMDYWYDINYNDLHRYWSYMPSSTLDNSINSGPGIIATDKTITFKKMTVNGNELRDVYYYYRLYA